MSAPGGPESATEPVKDEPQGPKPPRAEASGSARVYQAGRDQFIADRDLHLHYQDRDRHVRRAGGPVVEECPYPGLAAFGPEQADWYFGRDGLIAELTERLADSLTARAPLVVVAPSGAGKSSLLQAGLLPAIERGALPTTGSRHWPRVIFTPTAHPIRALTSQLALLAGDDSAELAALWAADRDLWLAKLRQVLDGSSPGSGSTRVLVVADQVEEIFTLCQDEQERRAFVDALALLADPPDGREPVGLVVLGLRADFYTRCADYPWLRTAVQNSQLFLGPMSQAELREAIVFPARAVGLEVETGLVEILLRDLGAVGGADESAGGTSDYEAGRLPLLAHALRSTWQQRHGHTLTVEGYRATGGIEHAVATTAERVFSRLETAGQQAAPNLFLRMVMVAEGAEDTRRRVLRDDLMRSEADPQTAQVVLDAFTEARLLTQERDTVAITHEALLRAWPRLHKWINDDRVGNVIRQELRDAAFSWDRAGRENDTLYRGSRLEAALTAVANIADLGDLDQVTRTFLAAATRRGKRAAQIRRSVTAVLAALVLVASTAAVFAFQQRGTALAERDTAIFSQITAEADRLRSTDSSLAAQLDLVAYRMHPQPDVYTRLVTDGSTALSTPLSHTGTIPAVAFSPDGHIMASGSEDGTIRLWNVSDPAHRAPLGQPLTGHTGVVGTVVFSPDGRTLASSSADGTVSLWNVTDPAHPAALGQPLTGHTDKVGSVAFSPDGRTLASGSSDKTIRLWNVTDPAHPAALGKPLTGHTSFVYSVAFSPDGRTLASGSVDSTVRLWDVTDPAHPGKVGYILTGHTSYILSVAFSPDGRTLASASADDTIRLWNVADPTRPVALGQPLTGHTGIVLSVAFSPDGRTLASSSTDDTIRFWSLPHSLLTGPTSTVESVAFSPDGHTLAGGSSDDTVELWNVTDPARPAALGQPLTSQAGPVYSVAFSPDGHTLASAADDGTVGLWNVRDPARPAALGQPLTGHAGPVYSVAFSPDGRTLASSGIDGTVRLWNVADPARAAALGRPLTGYSAVVASVAFSPDGHTLASGSTNSTVGLWNVRDPVHPVALGQPLTGHTGYVSSVAFSPDGHTLASGSIDSKVLLWNVTDPVHPVALGQPLTGHTSSVLSVAFSPDGHTLASGSIDQTIRLWDLTDPAHPVALGQPLTGHTGSVYSVAFSPDGHTLASGSLDQTVRLWDLNPAHAIQWICATTSNVLTSDQWQKYIPQLSYNPPCP